MDGPPHANGRRVTLGLLIDWCKDPYQNAVFTAIARACVEYDVNLLCATGGNLDPNDLFWSQRNILYEFIGQHNVDGLIVMGGNIGTFIGPVRLQQYLQRYRPLTAVCIAYELDGTPSVLVNNQIGLREVLEHLVDAHGYRRIGFIRGPAVNQEAEQRYEVYREVLRSRGIVFDEELVAQGDFNRWTGVSCMRTLLERGVKMDALVAANDLMALGALEVLRANGFRVPDDIALAGFDNVDEARLAIPQLTTVRQPFHILGREAVRVALAQIRGETVADVTPVASQVVIRRSCGCRANAWDETELISGSVSPEAKRPEIEKRFLAGFATLADEGIVVSKESALAMFDAVFDELDGKCTGRFAGMLADVMRTTATDGLAPWHRVITVIFRTLHGWTSSDVERRTRSDGIRRQLRAYVGDIAELSQGQQRVRLQRLTLDMSEAAKALTGTVSLGGLKDALLEHLPRLHIPACTMSLYADRTAPHNAARLELAYHELQPEVSSRVGEVFETKHLAPPRMLFSDVRETVILEPLFFEHEQLGILNLTMGPEDGVVYEAFRDQVSGAIRGAWLVSQVVEEAKRRQELEKEQADNEMRIAANIQTMILPQKYSIGNLDVAATMVPAVNVGGDYYDIHPTSDGCWLGIGDVVGHGLRSGLIMLMLQSAVSGLVKSNPSATAKDVICTANAVLYENIQNSARARRTHDVVSASFYPRWASTICRRPRRVVGLQGQDWPL